MASGRARSSGPVLQMSSNCFQRPISPNGRFSTTSSPLFSSSSLLPTSLQSSSSFCSTSAAAFSSSSSFFTRSASPTRLNVFGSTPAAASMRFSLDRSKSPSRTLSGRPVTSSKDLVVKKNGQKVPTAPARRTCMCSPTTHPGSFRCSMHKNLGASSNRLDARRSSMTNSLVRIGTVEGEWVRRALTALIRPSSHQQKRREGFQPRPSRLSIMSKAEY